MSEDPESKVAGNGLQGKEIYKKLGETGRSQIMGLDRVHLRVSDGIISKVQTFKGGERLLLVDILKLGENLIHTDSEVIK